MCKALRCSAPSNLTAAWTGQSQNLWKGCHGGGRNGGQAGQARELKIESFSSEKLPKACVRKSLACSSRGLRWPCLLQNQITAVVASLLYFCRRPLFNDFLMVVVSLPFLCFSVLRPSSFACCFSLVLAFGCFPNHFRFDCF